MAVCYEAGLCGLGSRDHQAKESGWLAATWHTAGRVAGFSLTGTLAVLHRFERATIPRIYRVHPSHWVPYAHTGP